MQGDMVEYDAFVTKADLLASSFAHINTPCATDECYNYMLALICIPMDDPSVQLILTLSRAVNDTIFSSCLHNWLPFIATLCDNFSLIVFNIQSG